VAALALASAAAGCSGAARPPVELAQARAEYTKAASGDARQYAPSELLEAWQALERAQAMARDEPDALETRTQAYVALRRAQKAEVDADTRRATMAREGAERAALDRQAQQIESMRSELQQSRGRLTASQAQVGSSGERQQAAEQRAAAALAALEKHKIEIRNGARVTVIPSTVLFVKNSAELLRNAPAELDKVAAALRSISDRTIRIEGYTDPTGGDQINRPLSRARAQAVRNYLVSRGLDPSRLVAEGRGSSDPIADNSTEAGRAINRRVELVIPAGTGVTEPMPNDQQRQPARQGPKPQQPQPNPQQQAPDQPTNPLPPGGAAR
jgi:outer membrane protein OmpA-like peptidoglycan-associated protein